MKDYSNYEEVLENLIEDWAFDNVKDGRFKCPSCNKWHDLQEAEPSSANPYSLPICKDCVNPKVKVDINIKV